MGRMNKRSVLLTLAFVLAGAMGAAFGARTAEAVVATLVEIVNPVSSPVPTSSVNATDQGRVAYQSTVAVCPSTSSLCTFVFPTVPAGHRVVVQQVSAITEMSGTPPDGLFVGISSISRGEIASFLSSSPISVFVQPVLFYVDASESVTVALQDRTGTTHFLGADAASQVTLIGYELDCSVAACAPIATQ